MERIAILPLMLLVGSCGAQQPASDVAADHRTGGSDTIVISGEEIQPKPSFSPDADADQAQGRANASSAPSVDIANERRDPVLVLSAYAAALSKRDWSAAAKAWGGGVGVDAARLQDFFDRPDPPTLEFGKGTSDAGAGSVYYEVPVTLRFGELGPPQQGTIMMRRVNDVPGASADQLRWHIERSSLGPMP